MTAAAAHRKRGIRPGTWLHRVETSTSPDGRRVATHYRRRVEAVQSDQVRVGGIERAAVPEVAPLPSWEPWGGFMSMPTTTTADKLAATGYRPASASDT